MAINNGRYVTTGDPREWTPNNEMIRQLEAAQLGTNVNNVNNVTPATTTRTFPLAEEYGLRSQGYANLGDTTMANAFGGLANDLGKYSSFANTTLKNYDALLSYLQGNEAGLQGVAGQLYNQLAGDIESQRNYINSVFGPEGTLTKEVDTYYDDLGNYLATEAGREAAKIAAQGVHSGASLGAIRAQQNKAYNEAFGRYVQAKEQQINAKQQIAANLINYMSNLRKEYGDTTNQYIIELYKRANDLYNNVALSVAQDLDSYNKLRFSSSGGGGSSASDLLNSLVQLQNNGGTTGTNGGGVITSQSAAQDKLGQQLAQGQNKSSNTNWLGNIAKWYGAALGTAVGGAPGGYIGYNIVNNALNSNKK